MNVQVVGGSKDGLIVQYQGPLVLMPVRSLRHIAENPMDHKMFDSIQVEKYILRRGFDGELFYVLEQASREWG